MSLEVKIEITNLPKGADFSFIDQFAGDTKPISPAMQTLKESIWDETSEKTYTSFTAAEDNHAWKHLPLELSQRFPGAQVLLIHATSSDHAGAYLAQEGTMRTLVDPETAPYWAQALVGNAAFSYEWGYTVHTDGEVDYLPDWEKFFDTTGAGYGVYPSDFTTELGAYLN